ncbi:hypothetical protein HY988_07565 [Candidatus Micrarchaeota archaeon]|nr:hypothetical protein [Candidatus Micrarchaeota archaeon]
MKICTLAAYALLGPAQETRKIRLRDRILDRTKQQLSKGIDSRIPFLKIALCNQNVSLVASRRNTAFATPDFHEGEMIVLPRKLSAVLKFEEYFDTLSRFNQAKFSSGLQAVPSPKIYGEFERYTVVKCSTELMGGLRISTVPADVLDMLTGTTAVYTVGTNQIFISGTLDSIDKCSALAHEVEHAIHYTLLEFSELPLVLVPKMYVEYLAMLVELSKFGSPDLFIFSYARAPASKQSLHAKAALLFIERFKREYGITDEDARRITFDLIDFQTDVVLSAEKRDFLTRIRAFAIREHSKFYEKIFGLNIDDIREVVDRLPNLQ